MRPLRYCVLGTLALIGLFVLWQLARVRDPSAAAVPPRARPAPMAAAPAGPAGEDTPAAVAMRRRELLGRFAYAQGWDTDLPPALAEFRAWTSRYRSAPAAGRSELIAEGVALARARRLALRELIVTDPQRALAVAVPMPLRQALPAEVQAELEQRVAGRGELALVARTPGPDEPVAGPSVRRIVVLGGATYTAHVYGRREPQTAKDGASLHGIAIGRDLALHESPLRALEPDEVPAEISNQSCPVSDLPVSVPPPGAGVNVTELNFAEVNGRVVEFCGTAADMLPTYGDRLEAAEDASGPRVLATPPRAAEAATTWTTGTKQVLVIRVDFSDFPGEPLSRDVALNVLNTGVRQLFEDMSYGQTTLVTTVSDAVYRMPQTGSAYALADNEGQLHTDARNAANAHYTVSSYDRIIVVFPNLGSARVPGSLITFGGEGIINGANIWINGSNSFVTATIAHELGHTYGLLHSNLWRVNDGNPLSPAGTTLEYGDPFDTMGSSSVTGVTRDSRHHFNPWHKNRLGWLPDSAVTTVRTSGTYRIHRFDHRDAPRDQPLALRILRDGVRWYWVGLRQNFASGSPQANGAHVVWGFNNRQQSQLLDLTTPGANANDSALPLGMTFSDPATGITIKPIDRSGTEPAQFLDVEVTMPATPNLVVSWGREGALFFSGNTGAPISPAPETYVPFGLTDVRVIAGGDQHVVALKADGTVVAWGDHVAGQTSVPPNLGEVVAIAAGGDVSGVVKRDGTVQLWGLGSSGQTTPPAGLKDVRELAIGRNHVLALKNDGTVVAWGQNNQGQATVPAGLADVVAVTAGADFSAALKRDGTVVGWGAPSIRPPAGLAGVTAISACGALNGGQFAVALKADGTVTAWGANNSGQTNVPAGLDGVVAIAAGAFHTLALRSDGSVRVWGSGSANNVPRELPPCRAVAATNAGAFAVIGRSIFITAQSTDQILATGTSTTLSVSASGTGPLSYQWRKDGVAIPGATGSTLPLASLGAGTAGFYDVMIRDVFSTATSSPMWLRVVEPVVAEVSRISNMSIRTGAATGMETLIVGFVVGGPGSAADKPLLVRGVGPALTIFGVNAPLADPKVDLYSGSGVKLLENDNWNPVDSGIFTSVGAFALPPGSRDAALYSGTMGRGSYSAQLTGVGASNGIVLAEIYDVTPAIAFGASTPRLINVSARALSGTGANTLTAGFVIAGPGTKTVLIRGIGPSLAGFGVTGLLADPQLELFALGGISLLRNDNWGGTSELGAAFTAVGAFQLAPDSRDAALLVTLPAGNYTAQVTGVNGTTGVALVEIYEKP